MSGVWPSAAGELTSITDWAVSRASFSCLALCSSIDTRRACTQTHHTLSDSRVYITFYSRYVIQYILLCFTVHSTMSYSMFYSTFYVLQYVHCPAVHSRVHSTMFYGTFYYVLQYILLLSTVHSTIFYDTFYYLLWYILLCPTVCSIVHSVI